MQLRIFIIIVGVMFIHNAFDLARGTVRELLNPSEQTAEQQTLKKLEPEQVNTADREPGKIPDGIGRYSWGAPKPSLPALEVQNKFNNELVLYKVRNANSFVVPEYLGSSKPSAVYAALTNDELSYVLFQVRPATAQNLLRFLTKKYGGSTKNAQQDATSYKWEGDSTVVIFIHYKDAKKQSVLQVIDKGYLERKKE